MIREKIISMTSKLSFILVVVFVYWMFISISHELLGLRVFDYDWYATGYYTVSGGILALLAVSIIINILFTLTKPGKNKIYLVLFIFSFPMVVGLVYLLDLGKPYIMREVLLHSAKKMVTKNQEIIEGLGEYRYDLSYLWSVQDLTKNLDEHTDLHVALIVEDEEDDVLLVIGERDKMEELPEKSDLIPSFPEEQYQYLRDVFKGQNSGYWFASRWNTIFVLNYPVKTKNGIIVLQLVRM